VYENFLALSRMNEFESRFPEHGGTGRNRITDSRVLGSVLREYRVSPRFNPPVISGWRVPARPSRLCDEAGQTGTVLSNALVKDLVGSNRSSLPVTRTRVLDRSHDLDFPTLS
jgi:hypothetical protein